MTDAVITTVQGTLELTFRNGAYGPFPVATLRSNIGTFACRDEWLEALDEGTYDGQFDVESIKLCSYITKNHVPEVRSYNKIVINHYQLDNMSDDVDETEFEFLEDPVLEEETKNAPLEVLPSSSPEMANDETICDEVAFIRRKLLTVGSNGMWNVGDDISIPSEIDRLDQRKITQFLRENGYKLIEPNNRLWGVAKEVDNV